MSTKCYVISTASTSAFHTLTRSYNSYQLLVVGAGGVCCAECAVIDVKRITLKQGYHTKYDIIGAFFERQRPGSSIKKKRSFQFVWFCVKFKGLGFAPLFNDPCAVLRASNELVQLIGTVTTLENSLVFEFF